MAVRLDPSNDASPALLRLKPVGVDGPWNRPGHYPASKRLRRSRSPVQWNSGRIGKHQWICGGNQSADSELRPLEELPKEARRTITEHYSSRTMAQQWLLLDDKSGNAKFDASHSRVLPPYGCEGSLRFTTFGRFLRRTKTLWVRKEENK